MRRRFFVEQFDGDSTTLRGETALHLSKVLRAEPGQLFELSDGAQLWLGKVQTAVRDSVKFSLVEQLPVREAKLHVDLLLAIVKFDRFEWAIEKATELGVSAIVPIATARSDKGLIMAAPKRAERWKKLLFESAQQSRRLAPPLLVALAKSREVFKPSAPSYGISVLLSEDASAEPLQKTLGRAPAPAPGEPQRVRLAIGPEGGWTAEEMESAESAQFRPASLGSLILRTETAVAAAVASINYALGA
jgi:16S rRNA (uracil1498-N3)-methyltransferase